MRIQDFKIGGGTHLKKLRRAEAGAKIVGVFRVKNHDFTPKNHIFTNLRGGGGGGGAPRAPPGSAPVRGIVHLPVTYILRGIVYIPVVSVLRGIVNLPVGYIPRGILHLPVRSILRGIVHLPVR